MKMYDPRTTLMTISNQLFRQPLIRAQWERWHRAAGASQQAKGSQYTKTAISGGLLCTIIALHVWYHYHFRAARTKAIARIWMLSASWVNAEKLRPDSAKTYKYRQFLRKEEQFWRIYRMYLLHYLCDTIITFRHCGTQNETLLGTLQSVLTVLLL